MRQLVAVEWQAQPRRLTPLAILDAFSLGSQEGKRGCSSSVQQRQQVSQF